MVSATPPPRTGPPARYVLLGLILLAAAVRFGTLGAKGFWGDELSTVDLVHRSLSHMLTGIGNLESTPPLYYLVSWLWVKVFPSTEVGIRAVPAICGVALVPVAYWIGRELASARAATITAGLVAVNPFLVWYSQEARSYSLLTLLSAIALLLTLRAAAPAEPTPLRRLGDRLRPGARDALFRGVSGAPRGRDPGPLGNQPPGPGAGGRLRGARRCVAAAPGAPATSARSCRLDQQGADPRATRSHAPRLPRRLRSHRRRRPGRRSGDRGCAGRPDRSCLAETFG